MVESQISPEYKFSITGAQVRVENLFNNGKKLGREGNTEEAFRCYTNALEIIKTNPDAFVGKKRLDDMNKIKSFYDLNGYGFECKEIIKECIFLIRQIYSGDSVELAMYYHGIGYTYERYMYYRLKLKAMQRSQEILQKSIKKSGENVNTLNAAAWIYTSLAYVFEENNDIDNAGKWYKKAEELLGNHEQSLDDDEKAFIYNGLHRHYKQLEDNSKAIDVLEKALELRKKIYYSNNLSEDETREALNHIINTHSNKIRIYLYLNQLDEAEREYQTCKNEYSFIWNRPKYLLSAKRRIVTDYGDILVKNKEYEEAYKQYWRALRYRRYQHYIDDFLVADLYFKISESLKNIKERYEEAMEYMIQAYVVYEETIKSNYYIIEKNREEYMKKLSECLSSRDDETLKQRLSVQQEFFRFRHDKRLDNRQDELIKYFDL